MTRDEIIGGFEREIRRIRREPKEKMLGVCITVDEAEEIVELLKEQQKLIDDITQRRANNGAFD